MARRLLSTRDTSQTAQQLVTFSRHLTAAPTTETFSHHRYWRHSVTDTLTAGVLYELHTIAFFYQYPTVFHKRYKIKCNTSSKQVACCLSNGEITNVLETP